MSFNAVVSRDFKPNENYFLLRRLERNMISEDTLEKEWNAAKTKLLEAIEQMANLPTLVMTLEHFEDVVYEAGFNAGKNGTDKTMYTYTIPKY